jgi:hypothetical protein
MAKCCVWRHLDIRHLDSRLRFPDVVSNISVGSLTLNIVPFSFFAMTDVATLGIGFPKSCGMAFLGSPMADVGLFGRVASTDVTTLGVGLTTSCPMEICGSHIASFGGIGTIAVATLGVVSQRRLQWHSLSSLC